MQQERECKSSDFRGRFACKRHLYPETWTLPRVASMRWCRSWFAIRKLAGGRMHDVSLFSRRMPASILLETVKYVKTWSHGNYFLLLRKFPCVTVLFQLAGIIEPNDCLCHLDEQGFYTYSLLQDYPSIAQVYNFLLHCRYVRRKSKCLFKCMLYDRA